MVNNNSIPYLIKSKKMEEIVKKGKPNFIKNILLYI